MRLARLRARTRRNPCLSNGRTRVFHVFSLRPMIACAPPGDPVAHSSKVQLRYLPTILSYHQSIYSLGSTYQYPPAQAADQVLLSVGCRLQASHLPLQARAGSGLDYRILQVVDSSHDPGLSRCAQPISIALINSFTHAVRSSVHFNETKRNQAQPRTRPTVS